MIYDPTLVQLMSVIRYAEALGLEYDEATHSFIMYDTKGKKSYMSFEKVQSSHNDPWRDKNPIPSKLVKFAANNKLVFVSALQWNKKLGRFTSQKNFVEFV